MGYTVTKTQLSNGLTVLLKEMHTAPIISHWMWYRVGSRDEVAHKTGLSHWVEHMQFKGTPKFPAGILDKAISRDGGMWNAFTYVDWTTYYETLPAEKIDMAFDLESDRMVNSRFEPDEVEHERTVVISEREGNENEPLFRLDEAVQCAAFDSHPYRNEVIGSIEDLRSLTRDDLYQHYRTYYVPNNAVVAVAGDFDTENMLAIVRKYYEDKSPGASPPHPAQPESPISEERRIEVTGPSETTFLQIAYRSPAGSWKDFFTLTLLDSLLTGPSGLNMFGGGISNKTSRLYRSLVEGELAVGVSGGLQATVDPFLYQIVVTVRPDRDHQDVLAKVDEEINRLQSHLVTSDEIVRAGKQARALFAYGSENITNQGFWLGFSEMFATYDWFINYISELEKVTPTDVQRIAQTYLHPAQRVVGTYIPDGTNGQTGIAAVDE